MNDPALTASNIAHPITPCSGSIDDRSIDRAMSSLQRLAQLDRGGARDARSTDRYACSSQAIIIFPPVSEPCYDGRYIQLASAAYTRNISGSGLCLVVPSLLTPLPGSDVVAPFINLEEFSLESCKSLVGLVNANKVGKWIESRIAWIRSLSSLELNAVELGLQFEKQHSRFWGDDDALEELADRLLFENQ